MNLDINTPRGQETLLDEIKAGKAFEKKFGWRYVHTKKKLPAKIDAVLLNEGNEIAGVVLASARYDCDLAKFMGEWNAEWLLTWRKLAVAARVARDMQVMLFGFLYIVDDDLLLIKRLYNPMQGRGRWLAEYRLAYTDTRATVNGGSAHRLNAFVSIKDATHVSVPSPFLHYCHECGAGGSFGYGVNLRADKPGTWYCREHRLTGGNNG